MTLPHLTMREGLLERVLKEVQRSPDVEIGGRLIGYVREGGFDVLDFIPTGPEPDIATDVELLPDRRYQLWTLDALLDLDEDLAVFGSWHSHIPNGLARFSGQDHRAYAGKMQPPYPYGGMVCGLIHETPTTVEDVRRMLRFAWFPAGAEVGEHTYWPQEAIEWTSAPLNKGMEALLDLTNHEAYLDATGRRLSNLDDVARAMDHLGKRSGHPTHVLRRSPNGDRLLLIEEAAGEEGIALEVASDGNARLHVTDEPTEWMPLVRAAGAFEQHLSRWVDVPTEWSHLSPSLVEQLMPIDHADEGITTKPSERRGFLARLFGR